MAERWSFDEGLGGGKKTSSGRAGSSGFSGGGNGSGGTGVRPAGVQSRDPYIGGVLRGVAPERHREVLQREAQRLTDASAGYEGQINQRRAEKYRDEDPQIQGWLGLIRGTDAQLRANGGKPLPGTLNDRVQRIQSALGEPLRLVPRPGVQPKPAGVQPAGGQPVRPKQGPAPKGVDRVVSAPRGYVASALQSMPAGQPPTRPGAGPGARGPMPAAPGQANRAPQQGGQPITNPRQQSGAFTPVGGRPETGWMKQAREDLVGAQARPLGATTLSQLLGTFVGPPQIGVGVTPPKSGMGTDPRKQQTQGPEAKKAAPGSRAREAAAQGQPSGPPSPRRQRELPDHLNRGSVRGSNSGRGPQEALPGGPGVSLRSARWTSGEDAGVPSKPATPAEKAYVKAHPPILSPQERERRNRAELAKYSDQGRHTFQRPVSAGSSEFYGAPPITETVLSEREQRVAGEGKFSVYDPFRGGVAGAEHPLEGVGRSFAGLVTGEHNEEVAKTRELYQRAQLEGKIPAAPLLAGPGEKNWEIRRQLQVRQLNRLKGSVNRFFHDVLEPVSNPHEFDYAQHGEGVAMAPRNPQQVAKEEAAVRQGFTPEKFEQWAKQNKIVLTPYQRQAVEHLMGARLLEEKRFGPELKALVIGLNVSALAGLGEGKLAAETEALTAKGVTKLSSGLGKTVGKVAPELGESLGKLGPRAVQAVDRFTAEGTPKLLRHAAGVGAEFGGLTPVLNRLLSGKSAEAVSREKNKWVGLAKESLELGKEGGTGAALGWLTGFGLGVVGIPAGKAGDVVLSSAEQAWANRLLRRQVTKLEQQLTQAEARLAQLDPRSQNPAERQLRKQVQAQISALNGELAHLKVGQGEPVTPARPARTETVPVRTGLQWPEGVSGVQPDPSFRPGATPVSPGRKVTVKGTGKAAPPLEGRKPGGGVARLAEARAKKAAAQAELNQAVADWQKKSFGKLYSAVDPELITDALPIARALVKTGVASAEELVVRLGEHLKGYSEEFRRAVVAQLEQEDGPLGRAAAVEFQLGDRVNIKGSSGTKPTMVLAIHPDGTVQVKARREPIHPNELELVMPAGAVPPPAPKPAPVSQRPRPVPPFTPGQRLTGKTSTGAEVEGTLVEIHSRRSLLIRDDGVEVLVDNRHLRPTGILARPKIEVPPELADEFRALWDEAFSARQSSRRVPYWKLSPEEAAHLKKAAGGTDLSNYTRAIDTHDIRHATTGHGEATEWRKHQVALTRDDFAKVPDVVLNYDYVREADTVGGYRRILYQKRVNGHIFYIEEIGDGDTLTPVTMWKVKVNKEGARGAEAPGDSTATPYPGTTSIHSNAEEHQMLRDSEDPDPASEPSGGGSIPVNPPSPSPQAGGSDPTRLSGIVGLGAGLAASEQQQRKPSGGNDRGGVLLARAVAVRGSLKHGPYVDGEGKKRTAKWYVVGATPERRAERELMAEHLLRRRPEKGDRRWFIPGVGSGTLRELVVEQGVVPAEVGNVYRQSPERWRSSGGLATRIGVR